MQGIVVKKRQGSREFPSESEASKHSRSPTSAMSSHGSRNSRSGFTIAELMIVVIIIAVLIGVGAITGVNNIKKANRDTTVSDMELLANNLSDAYYDLGSPSYDPGTPEGNVQFKNFLSILSNDYCGVTFDMDTIKTSTNGFEVVTSSPMDVYEQPFKFWFVTKDGIGKYVMVASGGEDATIRNEKYATKDYSDDIVLIVRPKI